MELFKINLENRNYYNWTIFNASTLLPVDSLLPVDIEFNPIQHKLLTGDIFAYENGIVNIQFSSVRIADFYPAVLILADNKTYGRTNGIKGKLLYKCIPDDIRLPIFLIPYEIKHVGFSKVFTNLYVTIKFSSWTNQLPLATLVQNIGSIDILNNYYEYQLYCKSLNSSIQGFNKGVVKALGPKTTTHDAFIDRICTLDKTKTIEDRTLWHVFSIDPSNCLDFDDAFSITSLNDNTILLSIYIANVAILIDALNLWSSFSNRVSTIYLPDKKRPMLPTILSDCLCSLHQGSRRLAFVLDLIIENGSIVSTKYSNCLINVRKNFVYEEPDLLGSDQYKLLLDTTRILSKKYKYISSVKNSHDVVCYLMILMNYYSAKTLLKEKVGIFRTTIKKQYSDTLLTDTLLIDVPDEVGKFIKIWNSSAGQYLNIASVQDIDQLNHDLLELDAYIHITSPIRRLVDLLNLIKFQQIFNLYVLSEDANNFYDTWTTKLQIDYINVTMRSIKKLQNDCTLLDIFNKICHGSNKLYNGYCFDKLARSDGLFQYIVYLPELKMTSRITIREDFKNYELKQYKLILFNNEEKFKKKIRLQLYN